MQVGFFLFVQKSDNQNVNDLFCVNFKICFRYLTRKL